MAISIDRYVDINSASSGAGSGDSVPEGSSDIQLFRDPASGRYFTPSEYVGTVEKRADGKYYANGAEANVVTYQTSVTGGSRFSAGSRLFTLQGQPDITPKLTASPPTITVTNNTAGAGSVSTPKTLPGQSYTSILCDDLRSFLPLGVGNVQPARGGNGSLAPYTARWAPSAAGIPQIVRPAFTFDGSVFSFTVRQMVNVQYRLIVDGEYVTRFPVSVGGTAGNYAEVKVVFASRAVRKIIIELCGTDDLFLGVTYQVNDSMQAIAPPKRRLLLASDSYGGGAYSGPIGSFGAYMANALGFLDFVNASAGSTGWLADGSYANIKSRLSASVIAQTPTDLIFALGHNDTAYSNAAIADQVKSVLYDVRTFLPYLQTLHVVGPIFAGSSPGVYAAMADAIRSGCQESGAVYVDTVANPIFTGSGRVGATTGAGNSDLYIGADGTHPTDAGSEWLGYQLAQRIRAASIDF